MSVRELLRAVLSGRNSTLLKTSLLLMAMALSGCYESKADLLGDHAVPIYKMDSIVVFRNMAYFGQANGTPKLNVCYLSSKNDFGPACNSPQKMSLERLEMGDYLVQIAHGDGYIYGIWHRSFERSGMGVADNCLMVLGEDIVGANFLSLVIGKQGSPPLSLHDGERRFDRLRADLAPYASKDIADRAELLRIAAIYEDDLFILDPGCPGDSLHIANHTAIHIKGDNRDLPDLE